MAASLAEFGGDAGLDFIQQKSVQTVRGTWVHGGYIERAHRGADLQAVVTQNGQPIADRGVVLRVGMVPPERRYAIGAAKDGRAEVLTQLQFEHDHATNYVEDYKQVKDARIDKVDLRHVPTVRNFVSVTIHPSDARRLLPLGQPVEGGPPPAPPEMFYSDTLGREVTAAEAAKLGTGPDPRDAEIEALKQKLEALATVLDRVQAAPKPEPRPPRKLQSAPCGKEMATGLPMHMKHCKKPECVAARAPKE